MNNNDHEVIEKEIHHIAFELNHTAQMGQYLSMSELAELVYSISLSSKRTYQLIVRYTKRVLDYIFDGNMLDMNACSAGLTSALENYRRQMELSYNSPLLVVDEIDDVEQVIIEEGARFGYRRSQDTTKHHISLLQNLKHMHDEVKSTIQEIVQNLDGAQHSRVSLLHNKQRLKDYVAELEAQYLQSEMWALDRNCFLCDIKSRMGNHSKSDYLTYLAVMEKDADPVSKAWMSNERHFMEYIAKKSHVVTNESLLEHFRFKHCRKLLQCRIQAFDALAKVQGSYASLFPNVACMEIAKEVMRVAVREVPMKPLYRFALLKLALEDMGLMLCEGKNTMAWCDFIHEHAHIMVTNDTITKITKLLLGHRLSHLSAENLHYTNIKVEDYERNYKDVYRHCVHIINMALEKDLNEEGFAMHWQSQEGLNMEYVRFENTEKVKLMASMLKEKSMEF